MKKITVLAIIFVFIFVSLSLVSAPPAGQEKEAKKKVTKKVEDKDPTVYVKEKGKKYHKKNCDIVKKDKKGLKLSEAVKLGYTPCKVCKPAVLPEEEIAKLKKEAEAEAKKKKSE